MGIDDVRARLDELIADLRGGSARQQAGMLQSALVDLKVALKDLNSVLERTSRELAAEQEQLAAAERRGKLAADIEDTETAQLAAQYAEKHRERVGLLERKLGVQQDEHAMAQREYQLLSDQFRAARQGVPVSDSSPAPKIPTHDDDLLQGRLDRRATEAAVDAQLEMLKKKLGK